MAPSPYFHVSFLVADLDAAIARFGQVMGVRFLEPMVAPFGRLEDPEPHESFVRCTYSIEGPPHIELLEGHGDGLFSLAQGEGLHHIGIWEDDNEHRCTFLRDAGASPAARVIGEGGEVLTVFTDPKDLFGVRLEYLSTLQREPLEAWLRSGGG